MIEKEQINLRRNDSEYNRLRRNNNHPIIISSTTTKAPKQSRKSHYLLTDRVPVLLSRGQYQTWSQNRAANQPSMKRNEKQKVKDRER